MDYAAVVRLYELFYYARWNVKLAAQAGSIDMVRKHYYALEDDKKRLDRALYEWKSVRDWKRENAEEGWELMRLGSFVQREMLDMQKLFRGFLYEHQNEAFPSSGVLRTVSAYERMLWEYQKSGVVPGFRLAAAAD